MNRIVGGFFAVLIGVLVAGSFHPAFGDEFQQLWRTTYDIHGYGQNRPMDMVITPDGKAYLSAGYEGSVYFGATGQLVRFNTGGAIRWGAPVASDGFSPITVSLDADENAYTASTYIPDVMPARGTVYFRKYPANGDLAWSRSGASLSANDAQGALTADNHFVVAYTGAYFINPWYGYNSQLTLAGFAPDGTREWTTLWDLDFTSGYERPLALLPGSDGDFYIMGIANYSDYQNILVGRYTSAGVRRWKSFYNLSTFNNFAAGAVDRDGSTYCAGHISKGLDEGHYLLVFSKDANGEPRWEKFFGRYLPGDHQPSAISVTPTGDLLVAGYTTTEAGDKDFLLLSLTNNGEQKWVWSLDGGLGGDDYVLSMAVDAAGNAYLVGATENGSVWDVKLFKVSPEGDLLADINGGTQDEWYRRVIVRLDEKGQVYVAGSEGLSIFLAKYKQLCDGCWIDVTCRAADEANPENPCQVCDPAQADDAWSPAAAGTVCDDGLYCNGADFCTAGDCAEHTGDPCEASTTCDEATDQCLPSGDDDSADDDDATDDDVSDDDQTDDDDAGGDDDDDDDNNSGCGV